MINTGELYERVRKEFGMSSSSADFREAFLASLQSVSIDMLNRSFVEWDAPTAVETNIDLEAKYYACIYSGCASYVNGMREWNIVPKGDLDFRYERNLAIAQSLYFDDEPPTTGMYEE